VSQYPNKGRSGGFAAHRLALMVSTSVLSMGAYGHLRSARAANECGVIAVGSTATCTPAGNNFTGGIEYDVNDATIVVQDGVVISATAANTIGISSGDFNVAHGNLAVDIQGTVAITTAGDSADGIFIATDNGTITLTTSASTSIVTSNNEAVGIHLDAYGGDITVSGPGSIRTNGNYAHGIEVYAGGDINVSVGDITVAGPNSYGAHLYSNGGSISVTTGLVTNSGTGYRAGIYAQSIGGAISVTTSGIVSTGGNGVVAVVVGGGSNNVDVTSTGEISAYGIGVGALSATGDEIGRAHV